MTTASLTNGAASVAPNFNPRLWLNALTAIGGGYALASDRRLHLLVDHCAADALTPVMAQIVGNADRVEAVKRAIVLRQAGEA
jgi:hypothetical protein